MTHASDQLLNGVDTQALRNTVEAVRETPGLGSVTFALGSQWQGGCRQEARTKPVTQDGEVLETTSYVLASDEPKALLGTDRAASPAEYILQALAGCYAVTFAFNAAQRGIELSSLRLDLEADIDLQGMLDTKADVRPGMQEVRVVVHAESTNASVGQLEELTRIVEQRSPIRDTLVSPIQVSTTLATA